MRVRAALEARVTVDESPVWSSRRGGLLWAGGASRSSDPTRDTGEARTLLAPPGFLTPVVA